MVLTQMMYYQKNLNQKWNKMEYDDLALFIHEVLIRAGHKWKINGVKMEPSIEDVEELIRSMLGDIDGTDYDSIESGGILLKRDGSKRDLYVHVGEVDEDFSS